MVITLHRFHSRLKPSAILVASMHCVIGGMTPGGTPSTPRSQPSASQGAQTSTSGGSTTTPPSGSTTTPPGGSTATSSGGSTTSPTGGNTTTPSGMPPPPTPPQGAGARPRGAAIVIPGLAGHPLIPGMFPGAPGHGMFPPPVDPYLHCQSRHFLARQARAAARQGQGHGQGQNQQQTAADGTANHDEVSFEY